MKMLEIKWMAIKALGGVMWTAEDLFAELE